MIYLHSHQADTGNGQLLVKWGFIRSYTKAQVFDFCGDFTSDGIYVFVCPVADDYHLIKQASALSCKVIILGSLPVNIADLMGLKVRDISPELVEAGRCSSAPIHDYSESSARIQYGQLPDGMECFIAERPLLRYDFMQEWNNLGYGAVRTDASIWSIACEAELVDTTASMNLATVTIGDAELSSYVTLVHLDKAEVLWVNRPVGFIDSHEFRLIETFISNYLPETHHCLPLLREVPYGYDAMVTMRLDCDESIKSATPLFELYRDNNVPFSLAIKTGQLAGEEDFSLLRELLQNGGSLLSHTENHKNNWGQDFEEVCYEARSSRAWLNEHVPEAGHIEYAVSPFHQNPDYAVLALAKEGYKGFISGIICNDPQYLIARAGKLYNSGDIVSHSQQCMLHGDCLLKAVADPLVSYKKSAAVCIRSGAIFGYLDHPFSARYQYGWETEEQRLGVHQSWLNYLKSQGKVLFENEVNTLRYIRDRAHVSIWLEREDVKSAVASGMQYPLAYEYKGNIEKLA